MTHSTHFHSAIILTTLLALTILFLALSPSPSVAQGAFFDNLAKESVIRFYEDEIAGEPFVSKMSQSQFDLLQRTYNLSQQRLRLLLVLEDLGARVGNHKDLAEMSKMKDNQLFSYGKSLVVSYIDTLSEEDKDKLKAGFKEALEG